MSTPATTDPTRPDESVFDVGIDERLAFGQLLMLGLQNVFGMTGMFVFPGLLGRAFGLPVDQIAYLYGMTFMVCGLTTVPPSLASLLAQMGPVVKVARRARGRPKKPFGAAAPTH